MSSSAQIAELQAEISYYRDRLALARARQYRRGAGPNDRLEELQRKLESAQRRLRDAQGRAKP